MFGRPKPIRLAAMILLLALVPACGDQREESPGALSDPTPSPTGAGELPATPEVTEEAEPLVWYELLLTEKTYPSEEVGEIVLKLAEDEDRYVDLWAWFEFEEHERPEIDWKRRAVLFAGLGESGSCPYAFDKVSIDDESVLHVGISTDVPEDTACTMDWTPRVFVIALEHSVLDEDVSRAVIYDTRYERTLGPDDGEVVR